jgi:hypothetical protein
LPSKYSLTWIDMGCAFRDECGRRARKIDAGRETKNPGAT